MSMWLNFSLLPCVPGLLHSDLASPITRDTRISFAAEVGPWYAFLRFQYPKVSPMDSHRTAADTAAPEVKALAVM